MATLTSDVVIITIDGKWEIATAIGTAGDGTRTATKITDSIDEPRSVIAGIIRKGDTTGERRSTSWLIRIGF
jgi:hypothetical protein